MAIGEIEKLTEKEREELSWPLPHRAPGKALRIIEAQALRIAELEAGMGDLGAQLHEASTTRDQVRAKYAEALRSVAAWLKQKPSGGHVALREAKRALANVGYDAGD